MMNIIKGKLGNFGIV